MIPPTWKTGIHASYTALGNVAPAPCNRTTVLVDVMSLSVLPGLALADLVLEDGLAVHIVAEETKSNIAFGWEHTDGK